MALNVGRLPLLTYCPPAARFVHRIHRTRIQARNLLRVEAIIRKVEHKKKHISFNTFVEQCIAIDKPKKNASGYFGAIPEVPWMVGAPLGSTRQGLFKFLCRFLWILIFPCP
jgi:hypothetical protein